jgi:hypothetical protein
MKIEEQARSVSPGSKYTGKPTVPKEFKLSFHAYASTKRPASANSHSRKGGHHSPVKEQPFTLEAELQRERQSQSRPKSQTQQHAQTPPLVMRSLSEYLAANPGSKSAERVPSQRDVSPVRPLSMSSNNRSSIKLEQLYQNGVHKQRDRNKKHRAFVHESIINSRSPSPQKNNESPRSDRLYFIRWLAETQGKIRSSSVSEVGEILAKQKAAESMVLEAITAVQNHVKDDVRWEERAAMIRSALESENPQAGLHAAQAVSSAPSKKRPLSSTRGASSVFAAFVDAAMVGSETPTEEMFSNFVKNSLGPSVVPVSHFATLWEALLANPAMDLDLSSLTTGPTERDLTTLSFLVDVRLDALTRQALILIDLCASSASSMHPSIQAIWYTFLGLTSNSSSHGALIPMLRLFRMYVLWLSSALNRSLSEILGRKMSAKIDRNWTLLWATVLSAVDGLIDTLAAGSWYESQSLLLLPLMRRIVSRCAGGCWIGGPSMVPLPTLFLQALGLYLVDAQSVEPNVYKDELRSRADFVRKILDMLHARKLFSDFSSLPLEFYRTRLTLLDVVRQLSRPQLSLPRDVSYPPFFDSSELSLVLFYLKSRGHDLAAAARPLAVVGETMQLVASDIAAFVRQGFLRDPMFTMPPTESPDASVFPLYECFASDRDSIESVHDVLLFQANELNAVVQDMTAMCSGLSQDVEDSKRDVQSICNRPVTAGTEAYQKALTDLIKAKVFALPKSLSAWTPLGLECTVSYAQVDQYSISLMPKQSKYAKLTPTERLRWPVRHELSLGSLLENWRGGEIEITLDSGLLLRVPEFVNLLHRKLYVR